MATIQKRTTQDGTTMYRVRIRLKGFPLQCATFERITDARKWVQQTETAVREGRHFKTTEAKRHTLGEALERYIKHVMPNKPRSGRSQVAQLNWWKENIGVYTLADSTPAIIAQCRDKLINEEIKPREQKKGKRKLRQSEVQSVVVKRFRSTATVNRYLAALSHVFTVAVKEWGWVNENPLLKVTKMREPRGRVRFLNDDERARLLDSCKKSESDYLYLIVVLCLSTGARKMEIIGLKWDDVDFNRGVIVLHDTKNGERRKLPIKGHALDLMKEHAKVRQINSDFVFPSKNLKEPIDIRTPWETAIKRAEINNFRFHDLRHSAASYLVMGGASLAEIAEILGHKTLQMVRRYAHLSDDHTSKVVEKMNERIFGG